MQVKTLFPSPKKDGRTKGGLVLLHLEKTGSSSNLELAVSYLDRQGDQHQNQQQVEIIVSQEPYFDNQGIEQGIVLSRFVNGLKTWLRAQSNQVEPDYDDLGLELYQIEPNLGYWERQSRPLLVESVHRPMLVDLRNYLVNQDLDLSAEITLLDQILAAPVETE